MGEILDFVDHEIVDGGAVVAVPSDLCVDVVDNVDEVVGEHLGLPSFVLAETLENLFLLVDCEEYVLAFLEVDSLGDVPAWVHVCVG